VPADDRALIFVHIPKSGGMTLAAILQRHFEPPAIHGHPWSDHREIDLGDRDASRIRLLHGHVPYGSHELLSVPGDYITMLRDPVDRFVSLFYFIRSREQHELHPEATSMSLGEFAEAFEHHSRNHQTRLLSGALDDFSPATLEIAKRNLDERFSWVGLTDRFDESLLLLRRRFGWHDVWYRPVNVTPGRRPTASIEPAVADRLRELNALDVALVEHARARFDEALAREPDSFHRELAQFRSANRIYRRMAAAGDPLRRLLPTQVRSGLKRVVRPLRAR
jgi:hypothetical protein